MGLHVFFGCYHNLFRLMAKSGVLENLLVKDHTHTFVNLGGDVRELDFRMMVNDIKIGAPFHGESQCKDAFQFRLAWVAVMQGLHMHRPGRMSTK